MHDQSQRRNLEVDSLVFDLDGTLWDTRPAFTLQASFWNDVIRRYGFAFREITERDLRRLAGRSHEARVREVFGALSNDQVAAITSETRADDHSMRDALLSSVYAGVALGLKALSRRYSLYIVSNCESRYIEKFLELPQLGALFMDFECRGNTGRSKAYNLRSVIRRNGLRAPAYVGDSQGDQTAASLCQIPFVFATYGFGSCNAPTWWIDAFIDLSTMVRPIKRHPTTQTSTSSAP